MSKLPAFQTSRPDSAPGPTPMANAVLCLLVLALIPVLLLSFYKARGHTEDAIYKDQLILSEWAQPPVLNSLEDGTGNLPDILDSEDIASIPVATIIQPTDELAGAEITSPIPAGQAPDASARPGDDIRSNSQASETSRSLVSEDITIQSNRPSTIMIDGQPIDSLSEEITIGEQAPPVSSLTQYTGPLRRAPISGLTRSSPFGAVPAVNTRTGEQAVNAYARPYTDPPAGIRVKRIALIVGGLGVNRAQTERAINQLPPEITLSFAAQTPGLQNLIDRARSQGHEVMIELPMEPYNFNPAQADSQYVLRSDLPPAINLRNLDYLLSRAQGYFAVTNYLGEKFLQTPIALTPIIAQLKDSGLGLIHDGTANSQNLETTLTAQKLPHSSNQIIIDVEPQLSQITDVLDALEVRASSDNITLAMGFAYPATIDAILAWHEDLSDRGVYLAPASATLSLAQ